MDFSNKFQEILNSNETIIKIYKPNRLKYWISKVLDLLLWVVVFAMIVLAFSFMQINDTEEPVNAAFNPIGFAISFGISMAILLFLAVYLIFYYRNLYYCVTNERVITRSGVFGTDFKTLDMQMIGAINVRVSLLDKIVKKDTGSINFGSNSAPIMGKASTFIFKDIVAPYNECKEIKNAVDNFKARAKNQSNENANE